MRSAPLLATVALSLSSSAIGAQCGLATAQKLIPQGAASGDWVVHPDVDGDWMVVGAIFGDGPVADSGAAYVYQRSPWGSWVQMATLAPDDLGGGDWFGKHVAIDGDCIVVGATQEWLGGPTGKAYVFRFDGTDWIEEAELLPSDSPFDGRFGSGVSVDGDYIIVGAYKAFGTGRAYIYHREPGGWVEQAQLQSPNPCGADSFASHSVGIVGDMAVVGSRYDSELGPYAGAAYVYRLSGGSWILEQELLASDGAPGDTFGWWAETDGETIVIGAPAYFGPGGGAAYVFERLGGAWVETSKLLAPNLGPGDQFGYWATVRGEQVAIGAKLSDAGGIDSGATYVFQKSGSQWILQTTIVPPTLQPGDQFGTVAMDGSTLVIGALGDDEAGVDAGAFYVAGMRDDTPQAALTAAPTWGKFPLTVRFTDQSAGNVTSWFWDFGNGYLSTLRNPLFTYYEPGVYTVTLTATGPCGQSTVVAPNLVTVLPRVPSCSRTSSLLTLGASR